MAVVVIGGQSRNVGKSSVVAALIAGLPQYQWTAFKISQHRHDDRADQSWAIGEEQEASGESDTSRFLAAGAIQAWRVSAEPGYLAKAMPAIRERLVQARNAIIESNSILNFVRPDLYLTVLNPAIADFKKSAQEFLDRADAVILHEATNETEMLPGWKEISGRLNRPIFTIQPPRYVTPAMVDFVEAKLRSLGAGAM